MKPVAIKTLANISKNGKNIFIKKDIKSHYEFYTEEETFTSILMCDNYLTLDIFISIFKYIESLGEIKEEYSKLTDILFVNEDTKAVTMNLISLVWEEYEEGMEEAKILVDLWENNKFIFGEETKNVFKKLKDDVLQQLKEQKDAMKN
jgi:hypothetical protein